MKLTKDNTIVTFFKKFSQLKYQLIAIRESINAEDIVLVGLNGLPI